MKVYGPVVDHETRCIHYHTEKDIIAIKFKCCNRYYPCFQCHNGCENHPIKRWEKDEFNKKAILCGHCQTELSIREYMGTTNCPYCGHIFNEGCATHYPIYFDV
ncbi:CHY zinc finger protein [Bacillus andreraoultii]|uniref:CHY zinc finger protein n=1 Tax=Bacillus andreraoultii TaxID=1499685 RepID=UPI00094675DA|nr:CHY zinc finger protein [Bacillus andreraoultii]